AMKMENAIHAGRDGRVSAVCVNNGDSVLEGAVLITIE
ncbi:MAG: acetyl-CoA carboxylase biotin carboxyl carrier protein subunit, partial [Muribaculaceae bacterium]|nr:acetyl-CoA carboxylase biotin carboxyl carrier protein subunit [Muribaculaceae bacterium]